MKHINSKYLIIIIILLFIIAYKASSLKKLYEDFIPKNSEFHNKKKVKFNRNATIIKIPKPSRIKEYEDITQTTQLNDLSNNQYPQLAYNSNVLSTNKNDINSKIKTLNKQINSNGKYYNKLMNLLIK